MEMAAILLIASLICPLTLALPARPRQILHDRAASSYDYVVVGCGAAGLTVSNRLTENPDVSVLCIEAGPL